MPVVDCYPTVGTDDGYIKKQDTTPTYPPVQNSYAYNSQPNIYTDRSYWTVPYYDLTIGLLRVSTASIPSGATIQSAVLHLYGTYKSDNDSRNLTAEHYASGNWPIDLADYTDTAGTSAFSVDLTGLSASGYNQISISNLGSIVKGSYTGFRFHISGGVPAGTNQFNFHGYAFGSDRPFLRVTYTHPPSAPVWVAPAAGATLVGNATLTATVSDPAAQNCYASFEVHGNSGYTDLQRTITGSTVASGSNSSGTWNTLLDSDGVYYLRAKAVDADGESSGWTNLGSVTVANPKGYQMMI